MYDSVFICFKTTISFLFGFLVNRIRNFDTVESVVKP